MLQLRNKAPKKRTSARSSSHADSIVLAPKPVHPRAVRTHGFFGMAFARQHMLRDERWVPSAITEEFKFMTNLLVKRSTVSQLESKSNQRHNLIEYRNLKRQIYDGRFQLNNIVSADVQKKIRSVLIYHKDMQRLYQNMSVQQVDENINQRTFVMRKERDRLEFLLEKLKREYKRLLIQKGTLENRIAYENEYVLEEERQANIYKKKIENSDIRLKGIKTINAAYTAILQVLQHDSTFYEPVLRSMGRDLNDQAQFIQHVLHLGMPALDKFKELSEDYKILEDKSRRSQQMRLLKLQEYRKDISRRNVKPRDSEIGTHTSIVSKRYARETLSMQYLRRQLVIVEDVIKKVKYATLISSARDIYPSIKSQVDNNIALRKQIERDKLTYRVLGHKMERASVMKENLQNDVTNEEVARLDHIQNLQTAINKQEEREKELIRRAKRRSDAFVLLRVSLWNLSETLRFVGRPTRVTRINYPNSYLKLPLLKFEMLNMRAAPPEQFEENLEFVMRIVKRKVHQLMQVFKGRFEPDEVARYADMYQNMFLDTLLPDEDEGSAAGVNDAVPSDEEEMSLMGERTRTISVPSRRLIKHQSAKIVDEANTKDF